MISDADLYTFLCASNCYLRIDQVSELSQGQKRANTVMWFHISLWLSTVVKFRYWWLPGAREMYSYCLMGIAFQSCKRKRVLEIATLICGKCICHKYITCITIMYYLYYYSTIYLKMVKVVNFRLCVFYHNKRCKTKQKMISVDAEKAVDKTW